jgi:hypothetical protein
LPTGWEFVKASSRTSESVLEFSNDAFDLEAKVVLAPSCDVAAATPSDSPRPGTQLYLGPGGQTQRFTFDGGCITFDFETSQLAQSPEGRALVLAVPFMTRTMLRELSGWTL